MLSPYYSSYIGTIKEIVEIEMCKFELWELFESQIAQILQMSSFKVEETEYRNLLYKENVFGYFNPIINEPAQ